MAGLTRYSNSMAQLFPISEVKVMKNITYAGRFLARSSNGELILERGNIGCDGKKGLIFVLRQYQIEYVPLRHSFDRDMRYG
jgi:hypothetical protein